MQKTKKNSKTYSITIEMNGNKITKKTNDVKTTLISLKPEFLFTELYVTIKKGKDTSSRKVPLYNGRKIFNNDDYMDIFVNNLLTEWI